MEEKLRLRAINKKDKKLLFDWANDEECRRNSFTDSSITLEEHDKWFQKKLNSPCTKIYILESAKNPIGQVRVEWNGDYWNISTAIAKEHRGMGYGKIMIQMLENSFVSAGEKDIILHASIKKNNIVCQKIFEDLNYIREDVNTYYIYTKQVTEIQKIDKMNMGEGYYF